MYYSLSSENSDPVRIKKERDRAQKLRKTQWWLDQVNRGVCHYCQKKVLRGQMTMDHLVPLARGGSSTRGNIVASCRDCNREKRLDTPVDQILNQLA